MILKIQGVGRPELSIVCCLHGDEIRGKEAIDLITEDTDLQGTIKFITANEKAIEQHKRFVTEDLNRSFPGDSLGSYEEKLAATILQTVRESDWVIDIHTTTAETEPFIITAGKHNNSTLIESIPIQNVVVMDDSLARGNSLIENVLQGVSLEFHEKIELQRMVEVLEQTLINLGIKKGNRRIPQKIKFKIEGKYQQKVLEKKLINFQLFQSPEGEHFYPIFYGEKAYPNITCLKGKRIE